MVKLSLKGCLGLAIFILVACVALPGVRAASPLAGKLLNFQGHVSVSPGGSGAWLPARINQELYRGDAIKTGTTSRAAILCVDESQIRLNENTILVLKNIAPSPRLHPGMITPAARAEPSPSFYKVPQGEVWLRNRIEKHPFDVETPAVTAGIRGTELNIRVKPDGTTGVVLLEGKVRLTNPYGEIWLRPGEEGIVFPGKAPSKRLLVQPADAVQWILYYPGIFSYRDLPLKNYPGKDHGPTASPAVVTLIRQAATAYDEGRLAQAQQDAHAALKYEPRNSQALTILGWVSLQRHALEEALAFFRQVTRPDELTLIGLALTRYRLGDAVGAYEIIREARHRLRPGPRLNTMSGFFAMMVGKAQEARAWLKAASQQAPQAALPRALLAQINLAQNRKNAAQTLADQALERNPGSPAAQVTMALVNISSFDLKAARRHLEKAIRADPRFVAAYVYLTKIWLGSDYLRRARHTIEAALRLAPREAQVLSMAGFVRLAFRDYQGAKRYFNQAIKANPGFGDPHLGLGYYHFRYRAFNRGLEEILAATLLEPRVALFQTFLGKALYQMRYFGKALEAYDYAGTLDPKDPTPYFYKGIALTDLNRPGEAVQAINRSIALNDNRAIFRSRLMLDRDLAVRNFNLARAYERLGLGDWALSKALTAVKYDPLNSSAHLFLAESYAASGERVFARNTELLLYRVLAPASQTTFQYLLPIHYTPMFEMPYARVGIQGEIGSWEERKTIQNYVAAAYGGKPGAAFWGRGEYGDDRGFRVKNSHNHGYEVEGFLKWEPTVFDNLSGLVQAVDQHTGDISELNNYFYRNSPNHRENNRFRAWEVSYLHRFSPKWAILGYFTQQDLNLRRLSNFFLPANGSLVWGEELLDSKLNFYNFQVQQQLVLGKHTFIGGFSYFDGHLRHRDSGFAQIVLDKLARLTLPFAASFRPPERSYTFYLLDYWRLAPWLLVELGVFKDYAKNAREGFHRTFTKSTWSPRLGLNIRINPKHTLRFALHRYLNTHLPFYELLVPADVAGFPWPVDSPGGTEVREVGGAWEAQWNAKTFSVLRLNAIRVSAPELLSDDFSDLTSSAWLTWKRLQGSAVLNRILTNALGLRLGVTGKRVLLDQFYHPFLQDFTEVDGLLGLSFLTPKGWQGGLDTFLIYQRLRDQSDNFFALVNLRFGKELPNKRGLIIFEVQNLFNRHFNYSLEPIRDPELFPARRLLLKVALFF